MLSNIAFLMISAVLSIAVNTGILQFLIVIFAVLLPNSCNVSWCNSRKYLSSFFYIFKTAAVHHIRFSKIKINFKSGSEE